MNIQRTKITPSQAEKWLDSVPVFQRKIRTANLNKLILAITRGEWRENGATIVFNSRGELIDGQHRLKAISLSGVAVWAVVVTNISSGTETFQTIDDGAARRLNDFIQTPYSHAVSSVLVHYWTVENGLFPNTYTHKPPTADILKLGQDHIEYISHLVPALWKPGRITRQHAFVVFLVFYHTKIYPVDSALLTDFFNKVADGLELKQSDPAYQLRRRFLNVIKSDKVRRITAQAMILKALNFHLDGEPCGTLKWDAREDFPPLRGYKVNKNQRKLMADTLVNFPVIPIAAKGKT